MSSIIMDQNCLSYLPLNLQILLNLTVYTLASTNVDQIVPNMVTIYTENNLDFANYESQDSQIWKQRVPGQNQWVQLLRLTSPTLIC